MVVEDDRRIRDLQKSAIPRSTKAIASAVAAQSAADARAKLSGLHFDLLILDVMMPGESGFDLARHIRKSSTVPIIMLTARNEAESRLLGLQIADDYIAKPFEPRELVLRIGNILKRAAPAAPPPAETVAFGPYVFHLERGELRNGEEIVHLTDRERDRCCEPLAVRLAIPCRGCRWRAVAAPPTSVRSTSRSAACGARSSVM